MLMWTALTSGPPVTFLLPVYESLIERGHLYIAQPPLYLIANGKEKLCYKESDA